MVIYHVLSNRQDEFILRGHRRADDPAPSDRSVEIRKRKRDICNIVHNSTWVIETFIVFSGCLCQLLTLRTDPYLIQCIHDTIGLVFARIIVPFTNLFAEQRIKIVVMEHGWICAMKTALKFGCVSHVAPMANQPIPMGERNNEIPRNVQRPQEEIKSHVKPLEKLKLQNNHRSIRGKKVLAISQNKDGLRSSWASASKNQAPCDLPNMVIEDFS